MREMLTLPTPCDHPRPGPAARGSVWCGYAAAFGQTVLAVVWPDPESAHGWRFGFDTDADGAAFHASGMFPVRTRADARALLAALDDALARTLLADADHLVWFERPLQNLGRYVPAELAGGE